jgi:FtsP/CotA-like multicopper oxidase with cupredoxin domain
VIEGIEGQMMEITLSSMMPHTIHFHGLDVDQWNDGVPSTSGFVAHGHGGGRGGGPWGPGFGRVQGYDNLGPQFTYRFVAPHAGTYAYHCHVDTVLHFEMGMYGTVIIRPPDGNPRVAWAGGPSFDKEYIWQLHTFDSSWHNEMVSSNRTVRHRPDYFMINGKDGATAHSDPTTAITGSPGDTILIRSNNMGYQPALIQLGGLPFQVIASDGRPLPAPITTDQQLVAPGERYDLLVRLPSAGRRDARITYYDIRLNRTLGAVTTSINSG